MRMLVAIVGVFGVAAGSVAAIAFSSLHESEPSASPDGRGDEEPRASLWPADSAEVALIANRQTIAITDGDAVVDLIEADGTRGVTTAGTDDLVAISLSATDELVVLDLTTGETARRRCPGCSGVAIVDDLVISIDADFTLQLFNSDLALQAAVPIDRIDEPAADPPAEPITPTLEGVINRVVAVSYVAANGIARGGPYILSLHHLDGTREQSWTVDAIIGGFTPDSEGARLAFRAIFAAGACLSWSTSMVVDLNMAEPSILIDEGEKEDERRMQYISTDVWWNGYNEVVVLGHFERFASGDCEYVYRLRRFDLDGELMSASTQRIVSYRFLGTGCDRALMIREFGYDEYRLDVINRDRWGVVEGYSDILWTAPREDECASFPGLEGP